MTLPAAFRDRPIAHRGLHDAAAGRIENSLSAFRAAAAAGYGIELDVQLSRDGVAVVHHDATLDRLSGRGDAVVALSAADLSTVSLGGTDDRILSLSETLASLDPRTPVLVELKRQRSGDLAAAVAKAVAGRDHIAAMSFDPALVARLAEFAPDVPRGPVTCAFDGADWPFDAATRDRLRRIADYDAVGASFVSHDHADLDSPALAALKGRGATILTWTIRSPAEEVAARRRADNITFEGYLPDRPA